MRLWSIALVGALAALVFCGCVVDKNGPVGRISLQNEYERQIKLDRMDYVLVWDFPIVGKEITNVWLFDNVFLVYTKDYDMVRLDVRKGTPIWCYHVGKEIAKEPFVYHYPVEKGMKKEEDELIIICKDQTVQIVAVDAGELIGQQDADFPVSSPAWASATHIYIGGMDGRLRAYRKSDMRANKLPQWDFRTEDAILCRGEVRDPCVLVFSTDKKVYNLNAATGTKNWEYKTDGQLLAPPHLYRGRLYFGSLDTWLYALNAVDGSLEWKFGCDEGIDTTPSAIGSTVYCKALNGYFFAVDRRDGKEKWKVYGGEKVLCRGKEKVYILNDRKEMVAIHNETGQVLFKEDLGEVNFFVTNTDEEQPIMILGFRNGYFLGIKEREKY
jgi:outer membrane protein assembly factor BamB